MDTCRTGPGFGGAWRPGALRSEGEFTWIVGEGRRQRGTAGCRLLSHSGNSQCCVVDAPGRPGQARRNAFASAWRRTPRARSRKGGAFRDVENTLGGCQVQADPDASCQRGQPGWAKLGSAVRFPDGRKLFAMTACPVSPAVRQGGMSRFHGGPTGASAGNSGEGDAVDNGTDCRARRRLFEQEICARRPGAPFIRDVAASR